MVNISDHMLDYDKIIESSAFISAWRDEMCKTMKSINPKWTKDDINQELDLMLKEDLQVPEVEMDNNYTGEHRNTNLISILDWTLERKPIIAGNATFYKNQLEAINPIAKMVDGFLIERKRIKKEMFKIEDVTSDKYKDLDRAQQNQKILANSYYGASGMPKSAFYSLWSGPATTHSAQQVISCAETLFEGLLVDNYKFIDISECFHYMNIILEEDIEVDSFIVPVTVDELFDRLKNMFYDEVYQDEYEEMIRSYLYNLSTDEITRIFYKYNLFEFIRRHHKILNLYNDIFYSVKNYDYAKTVEDIPTKLQDKFTKGSEDDRVKYYNKFVNNQYFMDPNEPPDTVIEILKELNTYLMNYVYVAFMSMDRIHRLKYFPRRTVCIVDTDSNILACDLWVRFMKDEVLIGNYGRPEENNRFIIINTLAYFITSAIKHSLNEYGLHSNIPDEYRPRYNMKNEFYFDKLVIGKKKKRYISSIKLREGNLINPYKPDVKGFDYSKATTSGEAKSRFDKIVKKYILESYVPDVSGILNELRIFEEQIRNSILNGETTYLPLSNFKDMEAYADPYSQQGMRGGIAWNLLYPDKQISPPSKVSLLKLNIFTVEDMEQLKYTHPREYCIIHDEIFNSPVKGLSSKGLQVLSIPNNEKIPEWCMPYIDSNTVVNNILGQFKGVLDVFGINCPEVGKTVKSVNRKTKRFSNIVRF